MKNKMMVALTDSITSQSVLDYLIQMKCMRDQFQITLLHIFRKATAEEALMGKKFSRQQKSRMEDMLNSAKERLVEAGFSSSLIETKLVTEQYQTITDGIISLFNQDPYDMVVIGRKRMSKSEEFVLGDISIKLIRALENTAIVVVKTKK